jgi:hypothetical protein
VGIQILSPREREALPVAAGGRSAVRVTASWPEGRPEGARLGIVLDDDRIRYFESDAVSVELEELLSSDRDLHPGAHRLAAVLLDVDGDIARGPGGAPLVAATRFTVGDEAMPGPALEFVYIEPQGTFNGPGAAAAARLAFVLLGAPPVGSELQATLDGEGGGVTTGSVEAVRSYAVPEVPNGDYRVTLRLVGQGGTLLAQAGRTITINLDAPER